MKRSACSYLVSCFILSSFLFEDTDACWGLRAPKYGRTSRDYDVMVGSDLIVNCTLNEENLLVSSRPVTSDDLVIARDEQLLSNFTRVIDNRTIQLKIPKATVEDTGIYICHIFLSKENQPAVCATKINVGYPPHHVQNFSCINRNLDSINCSWSIEANDVVTRYRIWTYLFGNPAFEKGCPNNTMQPNSCEWSTKENPQFSYYGRYMTFTIVGNNSLGETVDEFKVDVFSIVIPNSPEDLEIFNISEQSATVRWKPPTMANALGGELELKYQIWLAKLLHDTSEVTEFEIYDVENNTMEFLLENLIPYVKYNVSIRCQSAYVENKDWWSTFNSTVFRTLADVPYNAPEVIPEAFEVHDLYHLRSAVLYWKAVPKLHHNGKEFYYHIKYKAVDSNESQIYIHNTNNSSITIKNLQKNLPYTFEIYSANEKGMSKDYGDIFIDSQDKIPPAPKEVKVILQDIGQYNLTWNPPNDVDNFSYIVFWCSSLKPFLTPFRCDDSINWTNEKLSDNSMIVNVSNIKTNYQFAVVSKSEMGSSSMAWAECTLSRKTGLNKIRYFNVEPKSPTTLKVLWGVDCPAEKQMLKTYKITYCGVDKHKECRTVEAEPSTDNFVLDKLAPYTNYSIKIRAISIDNKSSEVSDEVYQSTQPGAPSGPPQSINVYSNSKDGFYVRWAPPLEPNGIITEYIVNYNNLKKHFKVESQQTEYNMTIDGLSPYSKYDVQIQACVNSHCSVKSEPITIRTEVAEPGYMEPPRIEEENSTHFKVSWAAPVTPNGPIDFYVIKWHPEKQNSSAFPNNTLEVFGATSVILDVKCPPVDDRRSDEGTKYLFYVRAGNKKGSTKLYGPFSESTQAKACQMPEGVGMFIGTIVGAAFGAIFFLVVIYRFATWMKLKIHEVKKMRIQLPAGLDGPETNPLNDYERFKDGLNENLQKNNGERLSYITDENKNRHGSGSSQFSNSSAEEMVYRNDKCVKFGRKPSGDSSGCSSLSSNITPRVHLSSGTDSGTESDFVIPPSPDSGVTEPVLLNTHKTPLPILMEVHDQNPLEKNVKQNVIPQKQHLQHKNAVDDIILKVDPPYSKFGYAGNPASSVFWRINPLVFYNCNLANSEPSVFEAKVEEKSETVFAPYSKVGLAKSSGDINLANAKQIGYAKFGYPSSQKRFSIPPPNVNPYAMVMLQNPDKKEWPNIKKLLDDKYYHHKINENKQISPPNNLAEDSGYIKVGKNKLCTKAPPSKGYVPFHEIRNQMDQNQPFAVDNCDHGKVYSKCNDHTDFTDDTEWPSFNNREEETNVDTPEILFDAPFSPNSTDCAPLGGRIFIANNYDCSPIEHQNSNDSLSKVPSDSDIKLSPDSPTLSLSEISFENNSFLQHHSRSLPNSIVSSNVSSISPESHSSENNSIKVDSFNMPNEVIMTPATLRNGYVPFHSLSDSMCDNTFSSLPNNTALTNPQNCVSNSVYPDSHNYKESSHNEDNTFLRQSLPPKTVALASPVKAESVNDTQKCFENASVYSNLSLNYLLKPLPKMDSEVCEV